MRVALFVCLSMLFCVPGAPVARAFEPTAPSPTPTSSLPAAVTAAALAADVDILQSAYEQLHPGLYRYNTPEQMKLHFATLRAALDHEQSARDAYLALAQFAAKVRCGHTYANFSNQTAATRQALFEGENRVPFYFRWLGGKMIVTRDFSDEQMLSRGTEVTAINGVSANEILAKLMTIARADGSNDAKRIALLEVQGTERYETFDVFLPLFFPQIGNQLTLTVIAPGVKGSRRVSVTALSYAQRLASRSSGADNERAGWTLNHPSPGLAVLRMPSWAMYQSKWDWKTWLQQSFEQLAENNTKTLVIDLRGNEGGLDVGEEILPHLVARELTVVDPVRRVRYRKVPANLAPMLDTWDPSFKDWGDAAQPVDERYFNLVRYQDASGVSRVKPRAPRFGGKVFVLVGAANSSATFQFAQQVQTAKLGVLVGQPTGGNQRGINGGAFFFLRLPNTKLELDLPLIATFPPGDLPDGGLAPDIAVQPSVQDIVDGVDADVAAVLAANKN